MKEEAFESPLPRRRCSRFRLGQLILFLLWSTFGICAGETMAELRQAAANRPRSLIFNNDGNEPVYFMADATAEALLAVRTEPLSDSQVDTIFYCTWSAGFGLFTHRTQVGEVFDTRDSIFENNLTGALHAQGIDPLQVMVDYGRREEKEVFWSIRMNDLHDANLNFEYAGVLYRENDYKKEHPEYMFGTPADRPEIGGWSGLDFGRAEVRDYAFRIIAEVLENYDIDGVELDFMRFPTLFKSTAHGQVVSDAERDAFTQWAQRIRDTADRVGEERGRPILIAVRLPDSVSYNRAIGIDLERWLEDDLIDMMTVGGYFQLNPWEESVTLAAKYGVKLYASIDDARIRSLPASRALRNDLLSKRGTALNLWSAGVDGIYMFNAFDPHDPLWRELGDPALLATLDKDYFGSRLGKGYAAIKWFPTEDYQNIGVLNPDAPMELAVGEESTAAVYIGDDFAAVSATPTVTLSLQFRGLPEQATRDYVEVKFNGQPLGAGTMDKGGWLDYEKWISYPVDPQLVKQGKNLITVQHTADSPAPALWTDLRVKVRFESADNSSAPE